MVRCTGVKEGERERANDDGWSGLSSFFSASDGSSSVQLQYVKK